MSQEVLPEAKLHLDPELVGCSGDPSQEEAYQQKPKRQALSQAEQILSLCSLGIGLRESIGAVQVKA